MKKKLKRANWIEKEHIPTLRFGSDDVLKDPSKRNRRSYEANRATILGNAFHNKARITFCTDKGDINCVETTVWAHDDQFLLLKSGAFLPMKCIYKIDNS